MKEQFNIWNKFLIQEQDEDTASKKDDVFNAEEFYKTALAMFKPPTELAGKLDTEERQFFQKYISDNIVGKTLPEKILQLNSLMENETAVDPEKTPINYILSSLGALKILQETIDDFNESTAGFTFEAFLSGLLGGKQVTERVGGSLPIEDCNFFVNPKTGEGGQPVSLKLLTGTGDTTSIEGSIPNLLDFFFRDQIAEVANEKGIEYIVALKFSDKGLGIYSFNITPENFFNWVNPKYFDFDKMVIPSPDQLSEEKEKSLEDLISRFKEGVEELYPMLGLSSFEPNLELLRVLKSGDYKGSPSDFNKIFKQKIIPKPQFRLPASLPKSRQEAARNFIDGLFSDKANTAYQKFMSLAGERLGPKYSKATELSDDLKEAWAQVREKPYSEWREVGTIIKRVFENRYTALKDLIEKVSPLEKASYNPILRHVGKFLGPGGEKLEGEEGIKMLIKTLGRSKDPKEIKKWSRILKSGVKATQFHIPARRVKQEGEDYGTLTFDKKAIFKIIEAYADVLKVQVAPVYRAFAFLNQEINAYFIENRPGAAGDASKFAVELKQEVDKLPEIKSYAPPSPRIDYGDRQQIGTMSDVPTTAKRESKDPALKENKQIKLKLKS